MVLLLLPLLLLSSPPQPANQPTIISIALVADAPQSNADLIEECWRQKMQPVLQYPFFIDFRRFWLWKQIWSWKSRVHSRVLAPFGARTREWTRLFHDHMRFHIPNSHSGTKTCPALPRLYLGSASAAKIRFLLIFVVFEYENTYDREKVAFTRAFWRLLVPERASERDFFQIMTTFIVQIAPGGSFAGTIAIQKPGFRPRESWRILAKVSDVGNSRSDPTFPRTSQGWRS